MFIVEPTAVVIAAYVTALVMREIPRLFALLIVRIADRLSAARHTQIVEALNGRKSQRLGPRRRKIGSCCAPACALRCV